MTGTRYGSFDLERILRTMRVKNGQLCIKRSGMHSVEDYLMARYQMYWQVYLHPDAAGYEIMLNAFFSRYRTLRQDEKYRIDLLEPVFDEQFKVSRYILLDDFSIMTGIVHAQHNPDPILADLARALGIGSCRPGSISLPMTRSRPYKRHWKARIWILSIICISSRFCWKSFCHTGKRAPGQSGLSIMECCWIFPSVP